MQPLDKTKTRRKREYKRFAVKTDPLPIPRHRRELDTSRETIRRPIDSAPRRAQDWR